MWLFRQPSSGSQVVAQRLYQCSTRKRRSMRRIDIQTRTETWGFRVPHTDYCPSGCQLDDASPVSGLGSGRRDYGLAYQTTEWCHGCAMDARAPVPLGRLGSAFGIRLNHPSLVKISCLMEFLLRTGSTTRGPHKHSTHKCWCHWPSCLWGRRHRAKRLRRRQRWCRLCLRSDRCSTRCCCICHFQTSLQVSGKLRNF